ncbi:hypothetical protein RUM43_010394 [Polyplax serrata]|uniref:Uncharacterized protein n=1 Tax=Polyplax serrata TaxID=468196 RepID=A0AAN8S779_POLSC
MPQTLPLCLWVSSFPPRGEFHLGFPRPELQGASWYQLLHWECMREAQSKHRLSKYQQIDEFSCPSHATESVINSVVLLLFAVTQSEQDRSCILLLRLQKRSGDWLWVHCVLQVKDNMENSQQPVIVCTNQVLSDREAAVMLTNGWLYHYYMVQSKLQYGLAYEAATATRMVAAAAYYHPHAQHPQTVSTYPHHISHQHLDASHHHHHHSYLQHQISPTIQHLHSHNGSTTPSHHQMHLSPNENHNSSPGYVLPHESNYRNERRLDPESTPVDYSLHSHSDIHERTNLGDHYHPDHNQNHINHDDDRSPPLIQHTSHKRRSVKVESVKSESSPRVSPNSEVIVDLDRNGGVYPGGGGGGGGVGGGGGGTLMLAATPVPLHSFARPRVLIKGGMVDPAEFMEQWNPSPPWSDTTVQKVPDIIHQDLSPYVTTTPPTPTGTPSGLSVGSLSHQPPHSAFTFDWAPEQYVPTLQHPRAVPLAEEEQTMVSAWPSEHRLFPLQPPPPPRLLQPTPVLKVEHDTESASRKGERPSTLST